MLVFGSFGKGGTPNSGTVPAALQEVRAYWESLREGGRLPPREAIDPRGIASVLEMVFLVERIAPGHARFRLSGNLFHDLMSMDMRGMPLASLFESGARQRLQNGLEDVFDSAVCLHLSLEAERGIGRPALGGRMMLLPLRRTADEPMMALGVLAVEGGLGRAPRRFGISTLRTETVFDTEVVSRITRAPTVRRPEDRPVVPVRATGKPVLRVVHSRVDG